MISLFSHAISTLLTKLLSKLFDKWGNSYIDRENEENSGSLQNVGVVKSICKQVQTAAYQGSNHGISVTGGFISHGYSIFGTEYLLSIDLRMCPMQSI